MVDMKCEGCVNAVKSKLETVEGSFFFLRLLICLCSVLVLGLVDFKLLLVVLCDGIGQKGLRKWRWIWLTKL